MLYNEDLTGIVNKLIAVMCLH